MMSSWRALPVVPVTESRAGFFGRMGQWTNQEKGQDALEELAMKVDDITRIAQELGIGRWQVERTIQLLDEGNTIPFIARYRKEMTGELNELQIRHIQERARQLRQLQSRREEIARLIEEQGNMTPELAEAIQKAATVTELEDLYRPYRPKRKTRASAAREKGLAPLAEWLLQEADDDVQAMAARYISEEKQVLTAEEALAGALDIVAETVADDAAIRQWLREWTLKHG